MSEPVLIALDEPVIDPGVGGDPHVIGFGGEKFDFMGEIGKFYNMLSAGAVQVNILIQGDNKNFTYIKEVGIKIGNNVTGISYIYIDSNTYANGLPISLLNEKRLSARKQFFPMGDIKKSSQKRMGYAVQNNQVISINTLSYFITVYRMNSSSDVPLPHLNIKYEVKELGAMHDGVVPHGVAGQTLDFKPETRKGYGKQGEGAIEGVYTDYEVSHIFADDFKFNRFGTNPTVKPILGYGFNSRPSRTNS